MALSLAALPEAFTGHIRPSGFVPVDRQFVRDGPRLAFFPVVDLELDGSVGPLGADTLFERGRVRRAGVPGGHGDLGRANTDYRHIMLSRDPPCWVVRMGECAVLLPRSWDTLFYERIGTLDPADVTMQGKLLQRRSAKFGETPVVFGPARTGVNFDPLKILGEDLWLSSNGCG